jgi:hypothetical protein
VALALALLASSSSLESWRPSQANAALTVAFSPGAGTFVGNETVALSAPEGADIYFTTDGSLPTLGSPVYKDPLTLDASTRLRAFAATPGASGDVATATRQHGPVATEVYLRVDTGVRNLTSHLPVILIHTFESGELDAYGTEDSDAAMLVLEPGAGRSSLVGRATLDSRIGIHVRGESSRRFPKKQYAVELRGDAEDADSDQPLLGLPASADWVLSDPLTYDRSSIRNALAYALSNRIGRYAPRTRFAEVFMVNDRGDVRADSFLGLFTLIEKIGRGSERVNVNRLPASATSLPAMSGGYILRLDKGVADFAAGGRRLQFVYPDAEDMELPERAAQLDFISSYIDDFARAASASNFRHPSTGQHYSEFIDVDAWIDHHILNTLAKNVDGLRISAYFHKERDGRLAAGPLWDFDRSFGTPQDPRAPDAEEWNRVWSSGVDYFNEGWWPLLFRDASFKSRYRDRFKALLDGELSASNIERTVDRLVADIGAAAERNLARWPQTPPLNNSYAAEIELLKDFVRRRVAWIKLQLDTAF